MLRSSFSVDHASSCFKTLETEAHSEGMRIARERLSEHLGRMEKQVHASRPAGLRVIGWRSRRLLTKIGEIELRRRYYVDAQGKHVFLLDQHIEVGPNRRVSPGLAEVAVVLSSEHSYRSSVRLIEGLLGVRIEAETAHAQVQRAGSEMLQEQQRALEEVLSGKAEIEPGSKSANVLMLEVDGVNIRLQREGAQRSVEIKNGIAYDGWEKRGNGYRLTNRQRYAMIANSEQFWDVFGLRIHQNWDISEVERVVVGGDGAGWVKLGLSYFTNSELQLDEYHTRRHINGVLDNKQWATAVGDCLMNGEWERGLDVVEAIGGSEPGYRERCTDLAEWIRGNASNLSDYRVRPGPKAVNARATGAIESNNDKYIANRFKKRGRGWTIEGARNLLAVINASEEGSPERMQSKKRDFTGLFDGIVPQLKWPAATLPAANQRKTTAFGRTLREISGGGMNRTY